jgi:outer membrane protein TolC
MASRTPPAAHRLFSLWTLLTAPACARWFRWVVLAALLSLPATALPDGEEVPPQNTPRLSLEDILEVGLEVSPKLWEQRAVIEQAEAQLEQARAGRLPRMDYLQIAGVVPEAEGNAVFSASTRSDLLEGLGPFTRIELKVNQPLYTFGKLKAHIEAAQRGLEAKEASLARFEADLIKTLKELYYMILLNEDLYRLVSTTEEELGKAVAKAEELLEEDEGKLTQQDILKLRYGYNRAGGKRLELEKGRRLVHSALRSLLCFGEGEDFRLKENKLNPVKIELADLQEYQKLAESRRPEWRQLDAGVSAKAAELLAEKKQYYPDIFALGILLYGIAPNRDKQENPFVLEEFNYLWGGAYLGWRVALDFGMPKKVAEKRAELLALRHQRREATAGMLLEVEKAYRDVVERRESLVFAREARKNGRALSALSAANFYLGLGEAKAVFEAFQMYTEGAAEYFLSIKDFNMAVAELARVTGTEFLKSASPDRRGTGG